jgi:hypothetical protein
MKNNAKQQINKVLMLLKMTLVTNGCSLATDHDGHLFIFNTAEYERKGKRLEKCDGLVVKLSDLIK